VKKHFFLKEKNEGRSI